MTKVSHVEDAAKAATISLPADEISMLDKLGDHSGLNVIRGWEKEMK